jgi:hypothetical protein
MWSRLHDAASSEPPNIASYTPIIANDVELQTLTENNAVNADALTPNDLVDIHVNDAHDNINNNNDDARLLPSSSPLSVHVNIRGGDDAANVHLLPIGTFFFALSFWINE